MYKKHAGTLLESDRSAFTYIMKYFLRVGCLLLVGLWLSACALSVQGKGKGKGLDVQPQVMLPIPQSGQIPIK
jgi:hypothetical protein